MARSHNNHGIGLEITVEESTDLRCAGYLPRQRNVEGNISNTSIRNPVGVVSTRRIIFSSNNSDRAIAGCCNAQPIIKLLQVESHRAINIVANRFLTRQANIQSTSFILYDALLVGLVGSFLKITQRLHLQRPDLAAHTIEGRSTIQAELADEIRLTLECCRKAKRVEPIVWIDSSNLADQQIDMGFGQFGGQSGRRASQIKNIVHNCQQRACR